MARNIVSGVLLVDKPYGPTSHSVVGWLRKEFGQRAIGHCGTLDPGATGLLVICLGGATRLAEYFSGADKCYDATFVLGATTTTDDAQGDVVARTDVSTISSLDQVRETLAQMVGPLELSPPAFSAIRVNGERSFRRARMGEAVALDRRMMIIRQIEDIRILERNSDRIRLSARLWVSKGTYIRSIASELGARLGIGGHLGALRRLRSAHLSLQDRCVLTVDAQLLEESKPPRWGLAIADDRQQERPGNRLENKEIEQFNSKEDYGGSSSVKSYLLPAWECLPFPFLDCESPELAEIFRRLELGQRISGVGPDATKLFSKIAHNAQKFCLIRSSEGSLVIVRHELDKSGYPRFAPERVIRRT